MVDFVVSYGVAIAGYFGLNVVSARFLGTSDFGYFVVVLTVTTLIGQQGLVGLHRAGLREAARTDDDRILGDLRNGVRAVLLVPLPVVALVTTLVAWVWRADQAQSAATAVLTGLLVYLSGYQKLSSSFLRGLGHVRYANLLEGRSGGALVAVAQTLLVLVVAWLSPEWGLAGALGAAVLGYLPPLLLAGWLLARSWGPARPEPHTLSDLSTAVRRDWRFGAAQAGAYLNSTLELWMAGVLLTGHATSLFAAGQRVSQLLLIPTTSLQVVFSPAVARLASDPEPGRMQGVVRTGASVATALSGLAWLPMVVAPSLLLTLAFGEEFTAAVPILVLLATGYFLNSVTGPSTVALSMSHHEGDVALVNWAAVVARVVAGLVCAHFWGATGLAASAATITALTYFVLWWAARRRVSVSTHATLRPDPSLLRKVSG